MPEKTSLLIKTTVHLSNYFFSLTFTKKEQYPHTQNYKQAVSARATTYKKNPNPVKTSLWRIAKGSKQTKITGFSHPHPPVLFC